MSHAPERKDKNCLNCGTTVHGRFCHFCGQENVVTRESFKNLVIHFFYDITHFDSKFFDTVKFLLFRPGFLSKEYMRGRRARYLNPIRMYVFTSAAFFLIFFSMLNPKDTFSVTGDDVFTHAQRDSALAIDKAKLEKAPGDPKIKKRIALLTDTSIQVKPSTLLPYSDDFVIVGTINGTYKDQKQYDSIQQSIKASERDGWLARLWNKRAIEVNEKYKHDAVASMQKISDYILHKLPYLLFISLPFFALILKLLYVRRKEFYYADHGIFSVHHYILSFILLLFAFLWQRFEDLTGWAIWNFLTAITFIALPIYLYMGLKKFYGQGAFKTFIKFLLLNIAGLTVLLILLAIFFLFSIFQI